MSKPISLGIIAALFVLAGWWVGGFDFNERGIVAFLCYGSVIYAFGMTATLVHFHKGL